MARALEDAGADLLACADIEEGAALRAAGVRAEILVFGALSVSDLDGLFDCRLTPTISTPGAARAVQAAAARYRQRLRYHLKIDTGMNRLGFRFDNLRRTLPELLASENLELDAVYTHFATADDPGSRRCSTSSASRFERALAEIDELARRDASARPAYRHAAQQRRAAARLARLVRPRPARACCSTASCRRRSRRRSRSTPVDDARQPRRRGEGHAAGRRRPATARGSRPSARRRSRSCRPDMPTASTCGWPAAASVLIRGRRAPIVGSVCMDMLMADVTGLDVSPGDEVVIIGSQGDDRIDVREMAATIGTIPWEIVCRIGTRIERVYT